MTALTFNALKPDYASWLAHAETKDPQYVLERAKRILPLKADYAKVAAATRVPILFLMPTNERESSSDMRTYLGNGDRVIGPTAMKYGWQTHDVPRHRGPFPDWASGAIDALTLDGMIRVAETLGWTPEVLLYEWEKWNGFGYRNHGVRTPYVVGGTTLQQPGRYAGDGNWTLQMDTQMGCLELARALVLLDSSLDLTPSIMPPSYRPFTAPAESTPPRPANDDAPLPSPPIFSRANVLHAQTLLNARGFHLVEDGSYGKNTRRATQDWQRVHGLDADGMPGPLTIASLEAAA